jgi:hypothetical protein
VRTSPFTGEFAALCGGFTVHTSCELEWYIVHEPPKALALLELDEWVMGERTSLDLGFRHVRAPKDDFLTRRLAEVPSIDST